MSFQAQLAYGKAAETAIAGWLMSRGNCVLPVYEKIIDEGKGPQLFTSNTELVAPDLVAFKEGKARLIEAKHKTGFTWHRITQRWVTGIDLRHYKDYLSVASATDVPVWLLFLHEGGTAKDSPAESPAGLFGNEIFALRENENHRHENWGMSGMVYWAREEDGGALKYIASLDAIRLAAAACYTPREVEECQGK